MSARRKSGRGTKAGRGGAEAGLLRDSPLLPILIALFALSALVILPWQFEAANLPQMAALEAAVLVLATLAAARAEPWPRRRLPVFTWWLCALLVWALLSILWAHNARDAMGALRPWLTAAGAFAVVLWLVRTPAGVRRLLGALVVAGTAVAVLGLCQALLRVQWVPQAMPPAATFMNRNVAASYVVAILPLSLVWVAGGARRAWLGSLAAALMAAYLFQTFTKSGWLAAGAEVVTLAALGFAFRRRPAASPEGGSEPPAPGSGGRAWVPWAAAAALLAVLVNLSASGLRLGPAAAVAQLRRTWREAGLGQPDRAAAALSESERVNSIRVRRAIWLNTLVMIREHPLRGVGAGNHKVFYPRYARRAAVDPGFGEEAQLDYAHNDYLQVAAELGLVGAALAAGALAAIVLFWRAALRTAAARTELMAMGAALVGLLVDAAFNFPLERAEPPVLIALLLASAIVLAVPATAAAAVGAAARPALATGLGVLLLLSLVTRGRALGADRHVLEARRAEARNDWVGSLAAAEEALALEPDRWDALFLRGSALLRMARPEEALGPLTTVAERYPYDLTAIGNLAAVQATLGHRTEALDAYRRLEALLPDDGRVHAAVARLVEDRGQMDEAEREWKEAARLDPTQAWYPYKVGVAAMMRGAPAEAESPLREALRRNPKMALAHKALGVLLLSQAGRGEEAREHLRRAVELDPAIPDAEHIQSILAGKS